MIRGNFIAFEGIDGSGKSTQAHRLADSIGAIMTFEPGATNIGKILRSVLLNPCDESASPVIRAEALLMAADRAQHVDEVIEPALASGRTVVTDRFSASTIAYQGYGRGLQIEPLQSIVDWAAGGLEPDLSILIDLPIETACLRMENSSPDRLELLDKDFHQRVRDGFIELAGKTPSRWLVVDGTLSADELSGIILESVTEWMEVKPRMQGTA